MLNAIYHTDFKKDYKKLSNAQQNKFKERLLLFLEDNRHPILRDHALSGRLKGKRAFSISGDIRVIYRYIDGKTVLFLRVGTHNQVYPA